MYNFVKGVMLIALIIYLGMRIHEQYSPQTPSTASAVDDTQKGEIANQTNQAGEGVDKPADVSEQKAEVFPEANNEESKTEQSKKDGKSKPFLSEEDKRHTMLARNESKLKNSLEDLPVESFGESYDPERVRKIGETYEKTVSILDAME